MEISSLIFSSMEGDEAELRDSSFDPKVFPIFDLGDMKFQLIFVETYYDGDSDSVSDNLIFRII